MEVNDIMRFQSILIEAADEFIDKGGSVGYFSPSITPIGAAFIKYLGFFEDEIDRDLCENYCKIFKERISLPITVKVLNWFWDGFDNTPKRFTSISSKANMDLVYEIGKYLRSKYDPE